MAREKQQLINYHTSGVTNMPQVEDVALGELVVRHATDKPELLIKKDNNEFATFVDSSKVQSMITTSSNNLQGQIDAVRDNLNDNYATSASTVAAIKVVDDKFAGYATSADTVAAIKAVDDKFAGYATSAHTEAAISAVQGNVDTVSNNLKNNYATSADTKAAIEAVDTKLTTYYATSASTEAAIEAVDTKLDKAVSSLTDTINNKISSAYIYKGSCTYAELSEKEKVVGHVYNVTDAHDKVPAGTNYAWDGESWDALAGIVDLTIYATSADTKAAISAVQGNVDTLKNTLTTGYATSASTVAAIKAVDDKFASYATSADTKAAIKAVDDKFASYATSADTKAAIEAVENSVTGLSASTVNIETTANSAIQTASIVDGDTCKVSVNKVNTELQFNFRNLVVDCGEF